ncbi:MAG: hypothetical protein EU536_01030 [Promethearchaeota archaeon]|nr:MAG: hypothetical protein EU536_01030 [Candidatus Lokiarchaeota archaeon]
MSRYRITNEAMLKREFEKLEKPITLSLFLLSEDHLDSPEIIIYLESICKLNSKLSLQLYFQSHDPMKFTEYQITEPPTLVIEQAGIRYVGVPTGPESMIFVQSLIMTSTGTTGVGTAISAALASLKKNVTIRTIITHDCIICPLAVKIGNMLTLETAIRGNGNLTHEIIESLEHHDYVSKFDLASVPIILINNEVAFRGIPKVDPYVSKIIQAGR